jgi:hypothetical protein
MPFETYHVTSLQSSVVSLSGAECSSAVWALRAALIVDGELESRVGGEQFSNFT